MMCQKPERKRILGKYTLAWGDYIKKRLKFYILKDGLCYPGRGESAAGFANTAMTLRISYIKDTEGD